MELLLARGAAASVSLLALFDRRHRVVDPLQRDVRLVHQPAPVVTLHAARVPSNRLPRQHTTGIGGEQSVTLSADRQPGSLVNAIAG